MSTRKGKGPRGEALLRSRWAYRLVRFAVGGVFLLAAVSKLLDLERFVATVGDFGIVPDELVRATSLALCALEVFCGVGLLFDVRGALSVALGLTLLFLGVLSYGIWLGLDVDCGCLGFVRPGEERGSLRDALDRDLVILVACGYLIWWRARVGRPRTEKRR